MSEHTATPWISERDDKGATISLLGKRQDKSVRKFDGRGLVVTIECALDPDAVMFSPFAKEDEANAALILRAVNAHEDLVRACKEAALVITATAKATGADPMKGTCLPRLLVAIRLAEEG